MVKIVYASLDSLNEGHAEFIPSKTVTASDGSRSTILTVDADSPNFGRDMTAAFRRNVAQARRENTGVNDETDHLASVL